MHIATYNREDFKDLRPKVFFDGVTITINFEAERGEIRATLWLEIPAAARMANEILAHCQKSISSSPFDQAMREHGA